MEIEDLLTFCAERTRNDPSQHTEAFAPGCFRSASFSACGAMSVHRAIIDPHVALCQPLGSLLLTSVAEGPILQAVEPMKVRKDAWEGFAEAVRTRRRELGLTAASVAKQCGMSRSYFSQIERGEIRNPTLETTDRILRALGLDLVLGQPEPGQPPVALVYESPFSLDQSSEEVERVQTRSALALLRQTLRDERIPVAQRKLLEQQVAALVWVVRRQVDAPEE